MNLKIILAVVIACLIVGMSVWYFQKKQYQRQHLKAKQITKLRLRMRKIWDDHVAYSRSMFSSIIDEHGDKEAIIARLMQNQDDAGAAFIPYYGEKIGNALAALLREHIRLAVEIVQDAKDQNTSKTTQDKADWIANADEIAAFLHEINPYLNQDEMQTRFRGHLESAEGELNARLRKEWGKDLDFYDKGREDMLELADALTDGIAKQFLD